VGLDVRQLGPAQLCRLLNSTPLGEVISERQLHRHRTRAGLLLGDSRQIDLLRYVAWLVQVRSQSRAEPEDDPYERLKELARARNAALAQAGRDIGELPRPANLALRTAARRQFRVFAESYFPETFHLDWSVDHLRVMERIEHAVLSGGLFALAMPRGSGKTSLAETACLWAILFGHREFVFLIGSDESHAAEMLESIRTELEQNERLAADFPEACYPIARLDGIPNRCAGQLYAGVRTHIGWTAREIVLPTLDPAGWLEDPELREHVLPSGQALCSGAIIRVAGITGRIRGTKFKRPDGRSVRPSLVVIDDPQTDESARSTAQCLQRESILTGAVLGLAGPGRKIAGIMPCTVIRPGDLADRILDRQQHPEWQGERTRMLDAFPAEEVLWQRYAELRADSLRQHGDLRLATEFYAQHREAMDAGAVATWPQRYHPDELSAVQHAMNLKLQDEAAFFAEYQNQPLRSALPGSGDLTTADVLSRLNRRPRGEVPQTTRVLTAHLDIQQSVLFYLVVAWSDGFSGAIVDYGTYPEQPLQWFTLASLPVSLQSRCPAGSPLESVLYQGLEQLVLHLCAREWLSDTGDAHRLARVLIDANWGQSTNMVYEFCRQSPFAAQLMPAHGRFIGPAHIPLSEHERRPLERIGTEWKIVRNPARRPIPYCVFDTNWWKTFCLRRLKTGPGSPGALTVFGRSEQEHQLLAHMLTSEYRVPTQGRGRTVDEWLLRPDRPDNHWWDNLVGAAVAASIEGVTLAELEPPKPNRQGFLSIADMKAQARRMGLRRPDSL